MPPRSSPPSNPVAQRASSSAAKPTPYRLIPLLAIEPARKIQARSVNGRFARLRWTLVALTQLLFYGLPWLTLQGQPAVLLDLQARRFQIFGAVFFPQDLIWLTVLLVGCALLLFFATALAGRVWCGFACPQTVYTELFSAIERGMEGNRLARLRLDSAPWSPAKLARRGGKHLAWATLSLWTGLSLVAYFTPLHTLLPALARGELGPWEAFWIGFYALATYLNAGLLREKVCQHMCPYGRFQGSMLDRHTLNVSYDAARGEPRGGRARHSDAQALGLGSCVDCTLCVQVCPVGIDIRQGLQSACINCGLCIDACNGVMEKLGEPRGLIRFASQESLAATPAHAAPPRGPHLSLLRRPRVLLYGSLLLLLGSGLLAGLWTRTTLRMDAMRDRAVLARQVEDGAIENVYRLLVMNASARPRLLQLSVEAPGCERAGRRCALTLLAPPALQLAAAEARHVTVRVRVPAEALPAAQDSATPRVLPLRFAASDAADNGARSERAEAESTLLLPH